MGDCPAQCPIHKFFDIHKRFVDKLGEFEHLCQLKGAQKFIKQLDEQTSKYHKKAEKTLVHEAEAYVSMAEHSCNAKRWDADATIVQTFCQACRDSNGQCSEVPPFATDSLASRSGDVVQDGPALLAGMVCGMVAAVGMLGLWLIAGAPHR